MSWGNVLFSRVAATLIKAVNQPFQRALNKVSLLENVSQLWITVISVNWF